VTRKMIGVRAQLDQHHAGAPVVGSPSTPQGGEWRKVLSLPLIFSQIIESGSDNAGKVATFVIDNPSARLHLKVSVVAQWQNDPAFQLPQSGAGAWYLQLDAFDRAQDGNIFQSNNIITRVPLPTSYEAVTMNDQWRGQVTIPTADAGAPNGIIYAIAAWEPAPGWNGDPGQLAKIFDACHLNVRGITAQSDQ
jgi:hypothetical protein